MNLLRVFDLRSWPDLAIEAPLRFAGSLRAGHAARQGTAERHDRITVRWPRAYECPGLATQIREMLSQRVQVLTTDLPQRYKRTILTEFEIDGKVHKVAFNISDYPDEVSDECTGESLVMFKFQFRNAGYPQPNVVPGGLVPRSTMLYDMLPYLRWLKDHADDRFDVYGRFSMEFAPGVRGKALRQLAGTSAFRFQGGDRTVRYSRYLREVARSKVCIDLPGEGPFCCRLVEYLAVGTCIVAMPFPVRLQAALIDGVHISCGQTGLPDLVPRCQTLLEDARKRREMELGTREFFDRYLHRDRLSAYYLDTVLATAGAQ